MDGSEFPNLGWMKRNMLAWSRVRCVECGAMIVLIRMKLHKKSICHQKAKRIRALLENNCMTFQEIGTRVGLTRERIRQIATSLGFQKGKQRIRVCTLNRHKLAFRRSPVIASLIRRAMQIEPISNARGNGFKTKEFFIMGKLCEVRHYSVNQGRAVFSSHALPRTEIVLGVGDAGYFVFPAARAPLGTSFKLELSHPEMLTHKHRHDYREYREAWHLLRQGN